MIHEERGPSLAGVVLLSDGGQNAGAGPEAAIELARENKVPVFVVGLGSDKKPAERTASTTWRRRCGPTPATAIR